MQTNTSKPQSKVSHKGSITGFILAILSFLSSGLGHLIIHAKYTPSGPTTGSIEAEAGDAIARGTVSTLGTLIGTPFLVVGIGLAIVSATFIVLRLRKVRVGGFIFSAIAVLLLVWSVSIALGAFDLVKADPVA